MAWLICSERVLASARAARTRAERRRGLIGCAQVTGALWIERCNWVHTFGVLVDLDVAYLDKTGRVIEICSMPPRRLGRPRFGASSVVEAAQGAFERWGVTVGDTLELALDR